MTSDEDRCSVTLSVCEDEDEQKTWQSLSVVPVGSLLDELTIEELYALEEIGTHNS